MKNIYIIPFLAIFFVSCDSGNKVSKDEYAVLNRAINHIIQPYGITNYTSSQEFNEIANTNQIDPSHINKEKADIINKKTNEKRGYEFAISDTLFEVSANSGKYRSALEIDTIKPVKEKLPLAVINSKMLKFPEGYKRITKKSDQQGEFIGKIKVGRVIFDKSGNKAIVDYTKCKNIDDTDCNYHIIRLRKMSNEWVIRN